MNIILLIGSVLGLLSVMMGAYIDHSLTMHLSDHSLHAILTAVKYQQFYALMLCVIGFAKTFEMNSKIKSRLIQSGYLFALGVILFSFSIYLSTIVNISEIKYLIPVGGVVLMLAWINLIRTALIKVE